jgi:hypothetical protein
MSDPSDTPNAALSTIIRGADQIAPGQNPPLHLWNPPFCGDIAIEIKADGQWFHEGRAMRRQALVNLFASILRREEDGEYYLVTPVEKCRIQVVLHPLMIVDVDGELDGSGTEWLWATLNTQARFRIDRQHPMRLEPRAAGAGYIELPHGLSALCARAAWYRLVELADAVGVLRSGDCEFSLQPE